MSLMTPQLRQRTRFVRTPGILLLMLAAAAPLALADLGRVGPTSPAHGYPAWYQDKTGLAMEFCSPLNAAELSGGWCLLLPADTVAPEVFPGSFSEEHFYWAASAAADIPLTSPPRLSKALLTLALEGAFASGKVIPGDQITFGRIRVSISELPLSGTYVVEHPYGTWTFPNQVAGTRLFFTEDIGITCAPGQFDCALATHIGPFLLPSLVPGGAQLPAVAGPVAGKLYVADPLRVGPVTGGTLRNSFRVVGPGGIVLVDTPNFSLMGRVYSGTIAGQVSVNRASYTQNPVASPPIKLDVFASAFETVQARLPSLPQPPAITPVLGFYLAPCAVDPTTGALAEPTGAGGPTQMSNTGSSFWGQTPLPNAFVTAIPTAVCVEDYAARDLTGQVVPVFFQEKVTDEVTVTQALYDPMTSRLSISASSSDGSTTNPVTLSVPGFGDLTGGQLLVSPIAAPPSRVRVVSTAGGLSDLLVKTAVGPAPTGSGIPTAVTDEVTILEDSGMTPINVLANDTLSGVLITGAGTSCPTTSTTTPCVAIVLPPRLGTAAVDPASGAINFTPFANASGVEGIGYRVIVNGISSSTAYVTINITPVNDLPVAVNDSTAAVVNLATSINVLANDTDPDGQADLANAVNVAKLTSPAGAVWTLTPAGGSVTFTANLTGTYTFGYWAQDRALANSLNMATVTVTVGVAETITVTRAEFTRNGAIWRVSGTDSTRASQTLTVAYLDGTAAGTVIGTAVVDALGAWRLDRTAVTGALDPTTLPAPRPTKIKVTSSFSSAAQTANYVIK